MRRFLSNEEAVAEYGVALRQPTAGPRVGELRDLPEPGAHAPLLHHPRQGGRMPGTLLQDCGGHRQQRVQVEGKGSASSDPGRHADTDRLARK